MKTPNSAAARAIAQGPRRRYLLGYVAAIEYGTDCTEWQLTRAGHLSALWPRGREEEGHVWPTKDRALAVARARVVAYPGERVYVRAYWLETSNPANAEGLREIGPGVDTAPEYVNPPQSAAA